MPRQIAYRPYASPQRVFPTASVATSRGRITERHARPQRVYPKAVTLPQIPARDTVFPHRLAFLQRAANQPAAEGSAVPRSKELMRRSDGGTILRVPMMIVRTNYEFVQAVILGHQS